MTVNEGVMTDGSMSLMKVRTPGTTAAGRKLLKMWLKTPMTTRRILEKWMDCFGEVLDIVMPSGCCCCEQVEMEETGVGAPSHCQVTIDGRCCSRTEHRNEGLELVELIATGCGKWPRGGCYGARGRNTQVALWNDFVICRAASCGEKGHLDSPCTWFPPKGIDPRGRRCRARRCDRPEVRRDVPPDHVGADSAAPRGGEGPGQDHPEFRLVARNGTPMATARYAFPEVRKHMVSNCREAAESSTSMAPAWAWSAVPSSWMMTAVLDEFASNMAKNGRNAGFDDPRMQQRSLPRSQRFVRDVRQRWKTWESGKASGWSFPPGFGRLSRTTAISGWT